MNFKPDVRDGDARVLRSAGRIILIDDDRYILEALTDLVRLEGHEVWPFPSADAFRDALFQDEGFLQGAVCVVCDVKMPGMDGLELQNLLSSKAHVGLVLISGGSGAMEAVQGFRAGALDFLLKPIEARTFLGAIERALRASAERVQQSGRLQAVEKLVGRLSKREWEVTRGVAQGMTNLGIALQLGITERTVKFHRHSIAQKLSLQGVTDLVRLVDEYDRLSGVRPGPGLPPP